ncbi:hypothetical protein FLM48_09680 [Shewanella sp. Scap07]|uniref:hypothetical protein n=1 Tax=Shewanella sp. Scap07 TaxID=2589987 RepID=UPI0015BD1FF6|nr:hypothetical protein [Shewanella sp. Scap07]QLE85330.1 hypothetical protein FLM48_09680 [Shewanella sp. Scap07]
MKKLISTIALSICSLTATAVDLKAITIDWEDNATKVHLVGADTRQTAKMQIMSSAEGWASVYFSWQNLEEGMETCSPRDEEWDANGYRETVYKINGQNVKMRERCTKYTDTNSHYKMSWAITDNGHSFIVNTFKNAKDSVHVKFSDGGAVNFSAKGFSREWNSFGGNAI